MPKKPPRDLAKAKQTADRYISPKGGKPKPAATTKPPRRYSADIIEIPDARRPFERVDDAYRAKPAAYVFGRPTAYDPRYCTTVVEAAESGHSLTGVAAIIGVNRDTITEWCSVYPDFSVACSRAKAIRALSYENELIDMKQKGGDNTRFQAVRFGMINVAPEEYKDRVAGDTTINITLATLIRDSMKTVNAPSVNTIDATADTQALPDRKG